MQNPVTPSAALRRPCLLAALLGTLWTAAGACSWEPRVNHVPPQQLRAGDFRFTGTVSADDRLLAVAQKASTDQPRHTVLLDLDSGEECSLGAQQEVRADLRIPEHLAPSDSSLERIRLAVLDQAGGVDQGSLYFADGLCNPMGPRIERAVSLSTLPGAPDAAPELLVTTDDGRLLHVVPFSQAVHEVASGVLSYRTRPAVSPDDPLGVIIWTRQEGQLVLVDLESRELQRLGEGVSFFTQRSTPGGELLVYEQDDSTLWTAASPEYTPARIAEDACTPVFHGRRIGYFQPCAARQLVLLDPLDGSVEQFAPGVFKVQRIGPWELQHATDTSGAQSLWASSPAAPERTAVNPPLNFLLPINEADLTGKSVRDGSFGVWSARAGYRRWVEEVDAISAFTGSTGDAFWIARHGSRPSERGVPLGQLSLIEQDGTVVPLQEQVPEGGHHSLAAMMPMVLTLHHPDSQGYILEARRLPDLLGSDIDHGVTTFVATGAGIYYTRGPGEGQGVWFAPL